MPGTQRELDFPEDWEPQPELLGLLTPDDISKPADSFDRSNREDLWMKGSRWPGRKELASTFQCGQTHRLLAALLCGEAELHLRSLKTHMQMEHLRCKRPDMVRKEFYAHLVAYNLIRGVMLEAALAAGVAPHQLSFKGAMQSLNAFLGTVIADSRNARGLYAALLWMIGAHRVANRPDRIEPRLLKRRSKPHKLLQETRIAARRRLMKSS